MFKSKQVSNKSAHFAFSLGLIGYMAVTTTHAAPQQDLKKIVDLEKSAYLETLKQLVNIESGSKDLEGTQEIARLVAQKLKATGAEVSILESKDMYRMDDTPAQTGPMVKAVLKGQGKTKIMLIAHMDTVYKKGMLKDQPFRIDANKAYGLGILDDKQGVAAVIHVLNTLQKMNYKNFDTITVLLNSDEEISSPGSRKLITETAANQDVVFSFEGGGQDGSLRLATSGIGAAYLDIQGKASHAGVKPEAGVNALTELAHQLLQMQDLSNPQTGLKLNWTVASSGATRNVIPDRATAQADARALRVEDFDLLEKNLQERVKVKKLTDSQVNLKFEVRRPPLVANDAAISLAQQAQNIYKNELNLPMNVVATASGGGTDAAFAGLKSKAAVVEGFGLSGDGAHSNNAEYILIDSIVPRLYLTTRLIMQLGESK